VPHALAADRRIPSRIPHRPLIPAGRGSSRRVEVEDGEGGARGGAVTVEG
jgi:hypothetical protein